MSDPTGPHAIRPAALLHRGTGLPRTRLLPVRRSARHRDTGRMAHA